MSACTSKTYHHSRSVKIGHTHEQERVHMHALGQMPNGAHIFTAQFLQALNVPWKGKPACPWLLARSLSLNFVQATCFHL